VAQGIFKQRLGFGDARGAGQVLVGDLQVKTERAQLLPAEVPVEQVTEGG
jgi:hypothetical protein